MRVTIFLSFVFQFCSCFRIPPKTSHTLRTTLHDQHYFYIDAYNDIKNALIPHDVYSTVAAETANMFIRVVVKKTEKNRSTVKYRLDSAIFFGCFFLGIPQTFNPLILSLLSIDLSKDYKKETICTTVGICKWLIYNKTIQVFGSRNEETFILSSFLATACASCLKYFFTDNYRADVFFKTEMSQILCFEHTKLMLEHIYPLDTELPFAALIDLVELDCSQFTNKSMN